MLDFEVGIKIHDLLGSEGECKREGMGSFSIVHQSVDVSSGLECVAMKILPKDLLDSFEAIKSPKGDAVAGKIGRKGEASFRFEQVDEDLFFCLKNDRSSAHSPSFPCDEATRTGSKILMQCEEEIGLELTNF